MSPEKHPIIADDSAVRAARARRYVLTIAVVVGAVAAVYYARAGLSLSHYDARSHLVVARRVIDNLTPGWRQFGAVWLPLPHLLNLLPVQWDWSYRTGFSGIVISVAALAWGVSALAAYLAIHTRSIAIGVLAPLALLLNPSVLYLQSTPLTEALLFGTALASLAAVDRWVGSGSVHDSRRAAMWLAALVMTRYEGWPIAAGLVTIALAAAAPPRAGALRLIAYPGAVIAAFLALSYAATGVWFVTNGFFAPDNPARGSWMRAFGQVLASTSAIAGPALMAAGTAGAAAAFQRARQSRMRSLLPLALLAAALLPLAAFHAGHPERVRYMVAAAVAMAALAGLGLSLLRPAVATMAAVVLLVATVLVRPPLSPAAPMVVEAQWELPFRDGRQVVTRYLQAHYDGLPMMASMSSLAHYMQDAMAIGLPLAAFLHEGNGDLWAAALAAPRSLAGWILIEERAMGGDQLARRARQDAAFLSGFERVAEGGGLALYRRGAR